MVHSTNAWTQSFAEILATDELGRRAARVPNYEVENRALRDLTRALASEPDCVLQRVVETALRLCGAGSAGISLLERAPEGDENFRWAALAGAYEKFVGGLTPADFSPCGVCLERRAPQLFRLPGRHYTYLAGTEPAIAESLYVPFPASSRLDGVVWIASHSDTLQFTPEDVRLLSSLADFTAGAMHLLRTVEENDQLQAQAHVALRERDRTENGLRQTNETLRTLIYSSPLPIVVVEREATTVKLWNPEAERLFGWREKEVLGQPLPNIPEEKEAETQAYRYATAQGKTFHDVETYRLRKDGSKVDVNILATPLYDADSRVSGMLLLYTDLTEKIQTAEALRVSEQRLAVALTAADMGTWSIDLTTALFSRDANCNRLLGHEPTDSSVPVHDAFTHVHPDDRQRQSQALQNAIAARGTYEIDYRFVRADGSTGWLREKGRLVGNSVGGPTEMAGILIDITARKLEEERIWASEQRYRVVVQASNDAIWDWDLVTNQVMWNEGLQTRFGYPAEEVGPRVDWWSQRLHPDDRQRVVEGIHAAIENGAETWQDEYRFQRLDGTYAEVFDRGHLVHNDHTKAFRMVGFMMDLTERKNTERLVRSSEAIYRAIGDSIDYGVWVCDAEGRNVYASDSFLKLVGMTQDECSAFGWTTVLHPDDAERTLAAWQECVRTESIWDIEHRCRGVDGRYHPILARGVPVRDEHGAVISWVGLNLDISRLKQAEEALKAADRLKDEFLATLSHELRNPLAPIRNSVQYLQLKGVRDSELAWAYDTIERQLGQMTRLIDDLLDVSRISRNKLELRRSTVELSAVIQAAVETSRPLIEKSGHELTVGLPSDPVYLDADLTRLAQVFLNLLNNAAKYSEPGSKISVTATVRDQVVEVAVIDNGVGIPAEMLPRIFDLFTQVDQSLERSQGGLGIGLTLVRRLVEMHGGQVWASSPGERQGSEFVVQLPVISRADTRKSQHMEERSTPITTTSLRILVVDDNKDSALSMGMMLQLLEHTTQIAYDGEAAVAAAAEFNPDLILLDIGLPKLNGYDACRKIRELPTGGDMIIVALTGWGQAEDKRQSADAGFDQHLVKPLDPTVLMSLLQDLSQRRVAEPA